MNNIQSEMDRVTAGNSLQKDGGAVINRVLVFCFRIYILLIFFSTILFEAEAQKVYKPGAITGLPAFLRPSNARILNGDFDGDGDPDILYQVGNSPGGDIHFLRNNHDNSFTKFDADGSGTFPAGTPSFAGIKFTLIINPDRATTGQPIGQRVFDYDGDGDQDIFEIDTASATPTRILLLTPAGYIAGTLSSAFPTILNNSVSRWVIGDIDSDGDQDILYENGNVVSGIHFLRNNKSGSWTDFPANGTGAFTSGPLNGITFKAIGNNMGIAQFIFDADGDGDNDMYELTDTSARYLSYNGTTFTVLALPTGLLTHLNPFRFVPSDYDNDGDIDFLFQTTNTPGSGIGYLRNDHNGTFTRSDATLGTFSGSNHPFGTSSFSFISRAGLNKEQVIIDLDGDGDQDIYQLSDSSSSVLIQTITALPVKLEDYKVTKREKDVLITWKTSEEINANYYSVEYSLDGIQFTSLIDVKSKGTGGLGAEYSYVHASPVTGLQYYRLVEYDKNGSRTAFTVKSIRFDALENVVQIFPNSVRDKVTARIARAVFEQVQLLDNTGRVLQVKQLNSQTIEVSFEMRTLPPGVYYLRLTGKGISRTERIFKE